MKIVNRPLSNYTKDDYYRIYDKVVAHLKNNKDVCNVCVFGGVNQPGISDIDLLITFKNNSSYQGNIIEILNAKEQALFTHGVMALSENHWCENKAYALWDNQELIFGHIPNGKEIFIDNQDQIVIKKETALEFLFTNYIDLTLQREYSIIKLRDLLQHTKGIKYDLAYLNIEKHPIEQNVNQAREWIANWNHHQPTDKEIINWFELFYQNYESFIFDLFKDEKIFLPENLARSFSKNIKLINSEKAGFNRNGILLPGILTSVAKKKTMKLLNKLNQFEFYLPIAIETKSTILEKRISFFQEMKKYNQNHFPRLGLLTTSLMSKLV